MTKLEQKLIQLGYELSSYDETLDENTYVKIVDGATLYIFNTIYIKTYYGMCVANSKIITQDKINLHQQAFNQLQDDLKELKECQLDEYIY